MRVNWTVFATNELHKVGVIVLCLFLAKQCLTKFVDKATLKNGSASTNPIRPHFEGPTARFLCPSTETFLNARTCAVATATSSTCMLEWQRSIRNWVSFYFKISRVPRVSCRCLPFNLEKMAAVSVSVFKENKCSAEDVSCGSVDTSLLYMFASVIPCIYQERKDHPPARKILSDFSPNKDFFVVAQHEFVFVFACDCDVSSNTFFIKPAQQGRLVH